MMAFHVHTADVIWFEKVHGRSLKLDVRWDYNFLPTIGSDVLMCVYTIPDTNTTT